MSKTVGLALILTATVLLSGCGGSDSTPTGSTPTRHNARDAPAKLIAQAKFVARADGICKRAAAKRRATNEAVQEAGSSTKKQLQVIARLAPAVVAEERSAMTQLRAIKAPSFVLHDWSRLLAGMQILTDDASSIATYAKAGDVKSVVRLTDSGRQVRKQLATMAILDGFHYCGRES
jgi:hypothetical protein